MESPMKMKVAVVMSITGAFDVDVTELGKLESGLVRYGLIPELVGSIDIMPMTITSPISGTLGQELKEKVVTAVHAKIIEMVADMTASKSAVDNKDVGVSPLIAGTAN